MWRRKILNLRQVQRLAILSFEAWHALITLLYGRGNGKAKTPSNREGSSGSCLYDE